MSKKNFSGGFDTLLGNTQKEAPENKVKVGRPTTQNKVITKASQQGTKEGEVRATFIVKENLLDKIKNIAYWERTMIKDIINESLLESITKYEKTKGKIKPIPNNK